ncbi:MAG TPA: hypothetical protein VLB85_12805 [Acidimicrobiia bacterium]|nr:hypothetical protein [Acidimicrobiia bacterium]
MTEFLAVGGGVLGLYRYGSSELGGLRPHSDLDPLLLTRRSLDFSERVGLTDLLLAHLERDAATGRRLAAAGGV